MKSIEETQTYYQSYYERVVKPKREAERQARLTAKGVARLPRGPERKYGPDLLNIHLKFSNKRSQFIRQSQAQDIGWQAWFDMLVDQEMERLSRE